jgi:hypothetical protein
MDNNKTIYLTGLYGQMIPVRCGDILRVMPHVVWTEVVLLGGTVIKVLEAGDKVEKLRTGGKEND